MSSVIDLLGNSNQNTAVIPCIRKKDMLVVLPCCKCREFSNDSLHGTFADTEHVRQVPIHGTSGQKSKTDLHLKKSHFCSITPHHISRQGKTDNFKQFF